VFDLELAPAHGDPAAREHAHLVITELGRHGSVHREVPAPPASVYARNGAQRGRANIGRYEVRCSARDRRGTALEAQLVSGVDLAIDGELEGPLCTHVLAAPMAQGYAVAGEAQVFGVVVRRSQLLCGTLVNLSDAVHIREIGYFQGPVNA
jgi:hypothetical protein